MSDARVHFVVPFHCSECGSIPAQTDGHLIECQVLLPLYPLHINRFVLVSPLWVTLWVTITPDCWIYSLLRLTGRNSVSKAIIDQINHIASH